MPLIGRGGIGPAIVEALAKVGNVHRLLAGTDEEAVSFYRGFHVVAASTKSGHTQIGTTTSPAATISLTA